MTLTQLAALMAFYCGMAVSLQVKHSDNRGYMGAGEYLSAPDTSIDMRMTGEGGAEDHCKLRYLITFGESYSQTGFNISGAAPSSKNPIGNPPLPGWTTSGGLNWVGNLVSKFNSSEVLAYNFAYGGATTSASLVEPYEPTVLSFDNQTDEFLHLLAPVPRPVPWRGSNSLVAVWIGVNDVGNSYYKPNTADLFDKIMLKYFELLEQIYDSGVRHFLILSVPPIYKTPLMQAQPLSAQRLEANAVLHYNDLLSAHLDAFVTSHSGVIGRVVDTQTVFNRVINNPEAYGLSNSSCYNVDGVSCVWWNNYHPGQVVHTLLAEEIIGTWHELCPLR